MPKITVKSITEIGIGTILKQLIEERGYQSQKEFTSDFNNWLTDTKSDQPPISEKDVSRWINGTVKPRLNKLELFATFFNVSIEYLQGKEYKRVPRKLPDTVLKKIEQETSYPGLLQSIKDLDHFEKLKTYCELLGYRFEYSGTKAETISYSTEIIENGKIYSVDVTDTIGTDPELLLVYPDNSSVPLADEQIKKFVENVNHALEYELYKLKK